MKKKGGKWPKRTIEFDNEVWKNEKGELHREDGPALKRPNGDELWYKNGELHREDGAAIEYADGNKRWCINGQLHREDGPAVESTNEGKKWYKNGELHREDGAAIEYANGNKYWYKEDKLHREDGPAVECSNGDKEYWLHGNKVEEKDLPINKEKEWPKCTIDKSGNKIWKNKEGLLHREGGPAIECADGDKFWYINGESHRENGPAIDRANGDKSWWINGNLYRENGPAIEYANGDKCWYINNKRHREDGPAVEYNNGNKEYYLNDKLVREKDLPINKEKELIKEEWPKCTIDENGTKFWRNKEGGYHREDGPAIESFNGNKYWYKNGMRHREGGPAKELGKTKEWYVNDKLHRLDGPARQWGNGNKEWYKNGLKHREDGPAVEYADGSKEWYINGRHHREDGPAIKYADGTEDWYINGKRKKHMTLKKSNQLTQERKSGISIDRLKQNAVEGLYAGSAKTLVDTIKLGISMKVSDPTTNALINSEIGDAVIAMILSMALQSIPLDVIQNDPRAQKLADKLNEKAVSDGFSKIMSLAAEYLLPAITNTVNSLPKEETISEPVKRKLAIKKTRRVKTQELEFETDEVENKNISRK